MPDFCPQDMPDGEPWAMRRRGLLGAAALGVLSPGLIACTSTADEQIAARALRRPLSSGAGERALLLRELVRLATLAPSSHNTQCWRFELQEQAITIRPDLTRRCPVVDPDDQHLHVSLGCAVENLSHAARAVGLQADVRHDADAGDLVVSLQPTRAVVTPLSEAIIQRQCTRGDYDGQAVANDALKLLEQAGTGQGVRVMLLTEPAAMERVLAYVVEANTAQMGNPAFMAELKHWIRFSAAEAEHEADGLFSGASGSPVLPRWLASPLMGLFLSAGSENERYARQVRNASGIAIFVSEVSDRAHWVETGRCYERFALQATALGLRNAFLNQPVEVGAIRPQFAAALGLGQGERPDLVVRFGRGPAMPMSMRRPVSSVIS
ncbi:Acg family FMN-binding oxidoreductase [Ideonella sp.]|uniref:Acg family FMN-binding oxidoreductase n=1 Tax=Ideonella sp. TaxID=1929293 RepID=UPI003BB7ED82